MSEDFIKNNIFKKSFDNIIANIKAFGLYKQFIIAGLIFIIISIGFYDSILPLFIQLETDFLNNLLSIMPLFILIIICMIAICSHFKIFGIDASFNFNHKIINFHTTF